MLAQRPRDTACSTANDIGLKERCPQIRSTSGYGDPRGTYRGAGGWYRAGTRAVLEAHRPSRTGERRRRPTGARPGGNAWIRGRPGSAWWDAAFLILSFLVVLALWWLGPKDR
ncbi:hypothetical protein GCM10010381_28050 [Streptomyces xantholiticus]|nr:hypothetical protein GCM10010381_28050 [Streptomyces xantholiticus]